MGKSTTSTWKRYALWGLAGAALVGALTLACTTPIGAAATGISVVCLIFGVGMPLCVISAVAAFAAIVNDVNDKCQ